VSVSRGPGRQVLRPVRAELNAVPPAGAVPANLRDAALAQLGHLWLVKPGGSVRNVSDVGDQAWTWTSTRINLAPNDFPDANPNAVLYSGGHRYVVDAGANILTEIKRNGAVERPGLLPGPGRRPERCGCRRASRAVLTARSTSGTARRLLLPRTRARLAVVPGHAPTVWATGLTTVQGCGFGQDGAFYATEFETAGLNEGARTADPAGDVVRIDQHGKPHAPRCRQAVLPVRLRCGIRRRDLRLQLQHRTRDGHGPAAVPHRWPGGTHRVAAGDWGGESPRSRPESLAAARARDSAGQPLPLPARGQRPTSRSVEGADESEVDDLRAVRPLADAPVEHA